MPTSLSDYGTVEGVAALATTYTQDGEFVNVGDPYLPEGTNPPYDTVEEWLESVRAYMDLALMEAYFVTPVSVTVSPVAYRAISEYVNSLTADLVAARNSTGRFFTDAAQQSSLTRWAQIQKDLREWVAQHADALVADNVPQRQINSIKDQPFVSFLGKH